MNDDLGLEKYEKEALADIRRREQQIADIKVKLAAAKGSPTDTAAAPAETGIAPSDKNGAPTSELPSANAATASGLLSDASRLKIVAWLLEDSTDPATAIDLLEVRGEKLTDATTREEIANRIPASLRKSRGVGGAGTRQPEESNGRWAPAPGPHSYRDYVRNRTKILSDRRGGTAAGFITEINTK